MKNNNAATFEDLRRAELSKYAKNGLIDLIINYERKNKLRS